jgi:cation transport ATPase
MVTERITIHGTHCSSCEKTITRTLAKEGVKVESISHKTGKATITHDSIPHDRIDAMLQSKGYGIEKCRDGTCTPDDMHKHQPLSEKTFDTERRIITNGILALIILVATQIGLVYAIYSIMPGYSSKYMLPLIYIPVAVVTNLVALWHQRAYRREVSCMTGMMIGMTIGMTSGFVIGGISGLINGMFTGSVIGTAIGIAAGVYAGRCCGTMGMMEGMMAGLMSGTMGAMLTVMMIGDHVEAFLIILIAITILILAGLMRVTVEETRGSENDVKPWPLWAVVGVGFIAMTVISAAIMLAPKSIYG